MPFITFGKPMTSCLLLQSLHMKLRIGFCYCRYKSSQHSLRFSGNSFSCLQCVTRNDPIFSFFSLFHFSTPIAAITLLQREVEKQNT
jgi:hypothetical protein